MDTSLGAMLGAQSSRWVSTQMHCTRDTKHASTLSRLDTRSCYQRHGGDTCATGGSVAGPAVRGEKGRSRRRRRQQRLRQMPLRRDLHNLLCLYELLF